MSFLIPEVFILFLCDTILLIFLSLSLFISSGIIRHWDFGSTSDSQYRLEKRSALVSVLIKYSLALKIPLFILFIYAEDKLANVLPGAMCAAGSVNATPYGKLLLYMKIFNIYFFSVWLVINRLDMRTENLKYTRLKHILIPFVFVCFLAETALFVLNFAGIDPAVPVSCCSTLFTSESSVFLSIGGRNSFIIFSVNYALLAVFYLLRKHILYFTANVIYFFTSIVSLILFTGTYVYELPTHLCPFCLLQSGYYYVGYLFYALLFLGTFSGVSAFITGLIDKKSASVSEKTSFVFNSLYFILSAYYPLSYFLIHRTWL
ncbi:MAG: hypothetical protein AB7E96_03030 [Deferribacterales bacterium]